MTNKGYAIVFFWGGGGGGEGGVPYVKVGGGEYDFTSEF